MTFLRIALGFPSYWQTALPLALALACTIYLAGAITIRLAQLGLHRR